MDGKEVSRKKKRFRLRPAATTSWVWPSSWRELAPYLFMGIVFILGFFSLLLVIQEKLAVAGRIVLVAMICAGLEYPFRNIALGPTSMEHEFSTLSDILCFVVVPGLLIYRLAFQNWGILGLAGLFILIFGGVIRLSLYKLYNPVAGKRSFTGLPLIVNAGFISLLAQWIEKEPILPIYRLGLLAILLALTFLTISTIPYPNPAERPSIFILAGLCVAGLFLGPPLQGIATGLLMAGGALYTLLAPWWMAKKGGPTYG